MAPAARIPGLKAARWAWPAYAAFVVYGSLVPLDFHALPLDQAWQLFKQAPFLTLGVESRADWVANGVLYVPMGLLGARALGTGGSRAGPALLALAIAGVLAFAVEFAQLYFPPRTVSQNDLLAEWLGSLVGVLAALALGPWLDRWRLAWGQQAPALARLALTAYVVAYVLYAFFPFDLLISRPEIGGKLASGTLSWTFALSSERSWPRVLLQWMVELLLTVPVGMALTAGRAHRLALGVALAAGALLGSAIEIGQIFIASGISQGGSVISRMAGVAIGVWVWGVWRPGSLQAVQSWLSRHLRALLLVYLVPLGFASGWGRQDWAGWERALQSWDELRLMPFYYHYYTAEAVALTSLGSVVVMYAPLAILGWARRVSAGGAGLLVAGIAVVIEAGKLFMSTTHPDPTNVGLAGLSVWLLVKGLEVAGRHGRPGLPGRREARAAEPPSLDRRALPVLLDRAGIRRWLLPLTVLLPVMVAAATWPAAPVVVLAVVALAAAASWWLPASVLVILPLALPVFDLAPWSGRFFFDEFDLLCAACLAVGWARVRPRWFGSGDQGLSTIAFMVFGISLSISAAVTVAGAWAYDLNTFSHYHSAFNGLRIAKGALWAWLFVCLYRPLVRSQPELARWFHAGMVAGLALTVLVVLLERSAFVGLLDFSTDYRVTGPFSTMNKGGAYIECYLAVASAFVMAEIVLARRPAGFWGGSILLALATYAVFVTYSRNGTVALVCALGVVLAGGWRLRRRQGRALLPLIVVFGLVTVVAVPVLGGSFARERLGTIGRDLQTRWTHWSVALDLRDDRVSTALLGAGLGRFPDLHYWHSRTEVRAAGFRLEPGSGNPFLRLGPGATVYIEQIVDPPAGRN